MRLRDSASLSRLRLSGLSRSRKKSGGLKLLGQLWPNPTYIETYLLTFTASERQGKLCCTSTSMWWLNNVTSMCCMYVCMYEIRRMEYMYYVLHYASHTFEVSHGSLRFAEEHGIPLWENLTRTTWYIHELRLELRVRTYVRHMRHSKCMYVYLFRVYSPAACRTYRRCWIWVDEWRRWRSGRFQPWPSWTPWSLGTGKLSTYT